MVVNAYGNEFVVIRLILFEILAISIEISIPA